MDSETLVNSDRDKMVIAGLAVLRHLDSTGFPVAGACWAKGYRWILYLATPRVDVIGQPEAYGEMLTLLRSSDEVSLTGSDITLVGMTHPVAGNIRAVQSMKKAVGRWRDGYPFGGTPFSEMYVYPANIPAEPAAV